VATLLVETPLWKWIALLLVALVLFAIFRVLVKLFRRLVRSLPSRLQRAGNIAWMQAIVDPLLVLLSVMLFRVFEEMIAPAALARLYVGRTLLLIVVGSFAWGLINLLDYVIVRLDRSLNQRQRVVSHSVIYLGRRVLKAVISILAAILILDNWGFNMTTIIAGLGVGGIALALAAQQTIANVFGGVSVIGDAPVMVGDFGNFGGVIGTVEDIGLRSARIRTLHRTIVSIPNSAFAGMNLENFAVRDKILFNPTFTIKRATSKDQIRQLIKDLRDALARNKQVEIGPTPVRISGYSAASFMVEVFAYVLTPDIDEYYKQQAELYLVIDEAVTSSKVELV
jgi:MscS family membrane protein